MSSQKMASNSVQGFKVLPLQFSASSTSCHNLFIKEHSVRQVDERKPAGKTLFVVNVPPYATEKSLKVAFSKAGLVKSVIFHLDNETDIYDGFQRAYVVFEKRESLIKVMKLDAIDPLSTDKTPLKIGVEKWIEDYNCSIYNPKILQQKVNTFIARYDKEEGNRKKHDKEESVDEEGWTVVTKKGRNPGISRKESLELKLNQKNKIVAEKKQLKNFYKFQIRESKKEQISELRKSFEEAKNKINQMKKSRKFKPY